MDEKHKKQYESYISINDTFRDIKHYIPYMLQEQVELLEKIEQESVQLKEECLNTVNAPLIGLKAYTEGKASWERAGEISDLHIFGLDKYCQEKGVNRNNLRIDEYYGLQGEEGIKSIKEEWVKLDPNNEFQPIEYGGKSMYVQYPFLTEKTKKEEYKDKIYEQFLNKVARANITGFLYKFITLQRIHDDVYLEKTYKFLTKLSNGFKVKNDEEFDYLVSILSTSLEILTNNPKNEDEVRRSFNYIKNRVVDNYYYCNLNELYFDKEFKYKTEE